MKQWSLLACLLFFMKPTNAQVFILKNTTNNFTASVNTLLKFDVNCSSTYCLMPTPFTAGPGSSASVAYCMSGANCPYFRGDVQYGSWTAVNVSYCGTPQYNVLYPGPSSPNVYYDIYPSGGPNDILVFFHY